MTDLPTSTAPAAANHPLVKGRCPACRGESLFLGSGGYVTCSRLDCPNPSAVDELLHGTHDVATLTAQARVATAEVERLRAGEEPGYDPLTVPTPGQWIARWNTASAEERLDVAQRVIANGERASRCREMNHEAQLADYRCRVKQAEELQRIAHETSNRSETERAAAAAELTRSENARDALRHRAERAEAAITRVRAAIHVADDEDVTDWQRGFRACSIVALQALDQPEPAPDTAATQATDGCTTACDGGTGIRGLLEHVGIDTTGRDITVGGRLVDAAPREHCGVLSPETGLTTPRTECVLRPGHTGSHADDVGCRWWPITEEQPRA